MLFYFISELIFCSWLFNLGLKIRMYILLQRLMVGAVVGMTAVVMIAYPGLSETQKMTGLGLGIVLIGVNTLFNKPIIAMLENQRANQPV